MIALQPVPFDNNLHNLQAYLQAQLAEIVNAINVQTQELLINTVKDSLRVEFVGRNSNGAATMSARSRNVTSVARTSLGVYDITIPTTNYRGVAVLPQSQFVARLPVVVGSIAHVHRLEVVSASVLRMTIYRIYEHASTFLKAELDDLTGQPILLTGYDALYESPGRVERRP